MATSHERPGPHARRLGVGQIAAAELRTLFAAVWTELRAACALPEQAEHVHHLRVATRRALAALDAFHAVLPATRCAWFKKRLRRLRRAAGEARDLDVLSARLAQNNAVQARSRLLKRLAKQRHAARAPIRKQLGKLVDLDWKSRVARLLADIGQRRRHDDFDDFAIRRLEPIVDSFFAHADRTLRHEDEIHSVRIAGKKLRYALEIFARALPGESLARCQRSLQQLQETLGEFIDHASAADRFQDWARSKDAGHDRNALESLRDDELRLADAARKSFSQWWTPSRRRALRRRFGRMLKHSA